jgi:hypothetical protein
VPEVDAAVDAVGFEARGHGADADHEAPATVLNRSRVRERGRSHGNPDCRPGLSPRRAVHWRKSGTATTRSTPLLYYAWLGIADPLTGYPLLVPPSAHAAGVSCHSDAAKGVQRAPTENVWDSARLRCSRDRPRRARRGEPQLNSRLSARASPVGGHPPRPRATRSGATYRCQGLPPPWLLDRPRHALDRSWSRLRRAAGSSLIWWRASANGALSALPYALVGLSFTEFFWATGGWRTPWQRSHTRSRPRSASS